MLIGGQDFRIYRVERDEDKIAALIEREAAFWQCVLNDVEPAVDGSESCGKALGWLYPRDSGETLDCTESVELNDVFSTLLQTKRERELLESTETLLRQKLQSAMGTASTAIFVGGKVSWKKSKDGTTTDFKRLLAEHAELTEQYTVPVSGSRRFLMQIDTPRRAES